MNRDHFIKDRKGISTGKIGVRICALKSYVQAQILRIRRSKMIQRVF